MAKKKTDEIKEALNKKPSARESIHISTGNDLMDILFGAGKGYGIESAQVVGMYASPSSGKTALTNEIIAYAKHIFGDKLKHRYVDLENGNHFPFKELYGFDIIKDEERATYPRTIEQWSTDVIEFMEGLADDEFGIYAIDSYDLLVPQETIEEMDERRKAHSDGKEYDKGSYGVVKHKYMKNKTVPFLREISYRKNCIIIVVMQVIDNLNAGTYGKKTKSSGGNALEHNFDTKIYMQKREEFKVGKQVIGHSVKVTSEKLRGPLIKWECMLHLFGAYGLDNISSSIAYLFDMYTDTGELKDGMSVPWKGKPATKDAIITFMEDNNYMEGFLVDHKKTSKIDDYLEYIRSNIDRKYNFDCEFGIPMNLREMITYVETNNLEEELTERVREKQVRDWKEATAVFDGRKPRFQKLVQE
jgi:RecA/RadA recombinase